MSGLLAQQPATLPVNRNISLDLASLIYTSGSTGLPKGVTLTHANMVAAATSITTYLRNEPDDIILSPLPLAFDYGLYQVLMAFRVGATVVLEKQCVYPYKYIELIGGSSAAAEMAKLCRRPAVHVPRAHPTKRIPPVIASTEREVEAARGLRFLHPVAVVLCHNQTPFARKLNNICKIEKASEKQKQSINWGKRSGNSNCTEIINK